MVCNAWGLPVSSTNLSPNHQSLIVIIIVNDTQTLHWALQTGYLLMVSTTH